MTTKNLNDLSDEQIDALTPEELAAYTAEGPADPDAEGEEEGEEGAENEGIEEEGEEEGEDDGDPLTPEQLAALANGDAAEEEGEDEGAANDMVPRSRLNRVLERERTTRELAVALLQQNARNAPQQEAVAEVDADPQPEFDFQAARKEYHRLVVEGEEDKAEAKLTEIDTARDALNDWKLRRAQQAARDEAVQIVTAGQAKRELTAAITEMQTAYPFLDNTSKQANEAAILAVNAKARELVKGGATPADALRKAAAKFGPTFAKMLKIPGKTDAPTGKTPAGKTPAPGTDPRSKAALTRNLGIRQPATQKTGVGNREQEATLDINNLSDEQIDKLEKTNPALLAQLRGDTRLPT
jgi:hypothetical protein